MEGYKNLKPKARLFGDQEAVVAIQKEPSPAKQKRIGKTIKNFDLDQWKTRAEELIIPGLLSKFQQVDECKKMLLQTANRLLIEASPHDAFFGVGIPLHSPAIWTTSSFEGRNVMGKMLTITPIRLLEHVR